MNQSITTRKNLPSDITSYDLLKAFAVVIMIIDHVGFYFFPDDLWWRAIGRIGFPVWFFLVGYARGRDIPTKLWGGALILMAANIVTGMYIFPLNALFTIIAIRLLIDVVFKYGLKKQAYLWTIGVVLFLLVPPSYLLSEYGTQALITAMYGYCVRHKKEIGDDKLIFNFMIFAYVTFIIIQQVSFAFSTEQFAFMAAGTLLVRMILFYFDSYSYPKLTKMMPTPGAWLIQLCGRRTLEIYILHLILFKFVALYLGLEGYDWFNPEWV